jgi:hypothetical protein
LDQAVTDAHVLWESGFTDECNFQSFCSIFDFISDAKPLIFSGATKDDHDQTMWVRVRFGASLTLPIPSIAWSSFLARNAAAKSKEAQEAQNGATERLYDEHESCSSELCRHRNHHDSEMGFQISPTPTAAPVDSLVPREGLDVEIEGLLVQLSGELSSMKQTAYSD